MSWEYCCPSCKAMLNPDRVIMLTAACKDTRILIGLHPTPGKYEVYLPPEVTAEAGTKWDFSCPVCQGNLRTEEDKNLCELQLSVDEGPVRILFSRVAGEHATFVLYADQPRERFGKDAVRYASRWAQMKYL